MTRRRFAQASLIALAIAIFAMFTRLTAPTTSPLKAYIPTALTMAKPQPPIIVIGSGLAGLAAAYSALQAGAPAVHLVDRAAKPGGNSIKASSGINGAGTRFQAARGIHTDTAALFSADTANSAGTRYAADRERPDAPVDRAALIATLAQQSRSAVEWLADDLGVDLGVIAALGGHSVPRTHRGAGKTPPGAAIVAAFLEKLRAHSAFTMSSSSTVTRLMTAPDGHVTGVEYTSHEGTTAQLSGPVVVAAGGFAGDATGLLRRYRPDLAGFPATAETRPGAHDLLAAVGAELVDMDSVQVHPTGFVEPGAHRGAFSKFLAAEMLRGEGGILLDASGSRFVNEMDLRSVVSAAIMATPQEHIPEVPALKQWNVTLLLDPGASQAAAGHLGFYTWKGLMQRRKISDLSPAVRATLEEYAAIAAGSRKDTLGRTAFGQWALAPGADWADAEVHVGQVTPVVHFTMGGVAFDSQARVLRRAADGSMVPIPGLFAAGEITGGIHGDNRLGGSSLLECAVYGRIAGQSAAASI